MAPDYVVGLFKTNFRLLTSEFGVQGVYKSKNGNWSVMTITGENDVIRGRNIVDTKLKAHFDDDVIMIGRSFYVISKGQFKSAADLVNQSQVLLRTTNQWLEIQNYSQIAYAARHNQILTVGSDWLELTDLEFLDEPPPPEIEPTQTVKIEETTSVNSETTISSERKNCPAEVWDGVAYEETEGDQWVRVKCPGGKIERLCNTTGEWELPDTSQCAESQPYSEFPEKIRIALESGTVPLVLTELTNQIATEENNEKRVDLVERVSSILMTFDSSYDMDKDGQKVRFVIWNQNC